MDVDHYTLLHGQGLSAHSGCIDVGKIVPSSRTSALLRHANL